MKYLALDIETTGLDPTKDRILEVAVIAVDKGFEEGTCFETVITCPSAKGMCGDYVRGMHTRNGLLKDCCSSLSWGLVQVEDALVDFVGGSKPMLLGFSVHFDRGFLKHWMPRLEELLHHRHIDASTLTEVLQLAKTNPAHRALEDARDALRVVREASTTWREGYTQGREDGGA